MSDTFEDLKVWKKAHQLVLWTYKLTIRLPQHEQYGVTQQLRRAIVSVPANIVEGWKRQSNKDNVRFLNIADSSLEESKYLFLLAHDIGYLDDLEFQESRSLCEEIGRMINGLQKSLKT